MDKNQLPPSLDPDNSINVQALTEKESGYHMLSQDVVRSLLKPRNPFSHKGTYGHALFVGGSYGKMGAAVLASRACLRAGVGLLTAYVPACGYAIMQVAVPEAMCLTDDAQTHLATLPTTLQPYTAIGVGCGMGQHEDAKHLLAQLLHSAPCPLVLDADAINIVAHHSDVLEALPAGAILTPHHKEFERLCGICTNRNEQLQQAKIFCCRHNVYVVLKGAYTAIVCPNGEVFFNPTGNPGMATAGSGDVLCGIILGLLAQGYSPQDSALAGVFMHGEAGDAAAASRHSQASITAGDIVEAM